MKKLNLTGSTFGRLVVVGEADGDGIQTFWKCLCTCGTYCVVKRGHLKSGNTRSCGCLQREETAIRSRVINKIHGESKPATVEFRLYASMLNRCYNPKGPSYKDYGGRGIRVCDRWRQSYSAFLEDMGRRPTPNHTLERVDNNKGYSPSNCKWATYTEQNRNRRGNRLLTFRGVTKCVSAWIEETGLSGAAVKHRVHRGWTTERLLTQPVQTKRRKYA